MTTVYNYAENIIAKNTDNKKRDRTKAAIQHAVCHLMKTKSLSALTVADICGFAKIAHGTFYIYFPDRETLVADLLSGFVVFLQDVMRDEARLIDADPIRKSTAAYVELFEQNIGLMKCLLNHQEDFSVSSEQFHKLNATWARTVVSAAINRFLTDTSDNKLLEEELLRRAFALGGMVDQYLSAIYIHKDPLLLGLSADKDKMIDTLTFIWKRGMNQ